MCVDTHLLLPFDITMPGLRHLVLDEHFVYVFLAEYILSTPRAMIVFVTFLLFQCRRQTLVHVSKLQQKKRTALKFVLFEIYGSNFEKFGFYETFDWEFITNSLYKI